MSWRLKSRQDSPSVFYRLVFSVRHHWYILFGWIMLVSGAGCAGCGKSTTSYTPSNPGSVVIVRIAERNDGFILALTGTRYFLGDPGPRSRLFLANPESGTETTSFVYSPVTFNDSASVAIDSSGRFVIGQSDEWRIRRLDVESGEIIESLPHLNANDLIKNEDVALPARSWSRVIGMVAGSDTVCVVYANQDVEVLSVRYLERLALYEFCESESSQSVEVAVSDEEWPLTTIVFRRIGGPISVIRDGRVATIPGRGRIAVSCDGNTVAYELEAGVIAIRSTGKLVEEVRTLRGGIHSRALGEAYSCVGMIVPDDRRSLFLVYRNKVLQSGAIRELNCQSGEDIGLYNIEKIPHCWRLSRDRSRIFVGTTYGVRVLELGGAKGVRNRFH